MRGTTTDKYKTVSGFGMVNDNKHDNKRGSTTANGFYKHDH